MIATPDNTPQPDAARDALMVRAREIYERKIRHVLEPGHVGEFVSIDVKTGDFEFGTSHLEVVRRAVARFGADRVVTLRVGAAATYRIGFSARRPAC
ncbi:MAG: hypothetical protein KF768_04055 [Phycisphaeraceae bacterium]|nr:hypothetical protein [Phycisphaeraceae bacterium]